MRYSYLFIAILFWQPIWWSLLAVYHLVIKRDTFDSAWYLKAAKAWFVTLASLVIPMKGV